MTAPHPTDILPTASLTAEGLCFDAPDGFDLARRRGAFHLAHPRDMDFTAGIRLARSYYLDPDGGSGDAWRGFRDRDLSPTLLGYSCTGADQDELLQIESHLWHRHLPAAAAALLWRMSGISRSVLRGLFAMAGVPATDVERVTGGLDPAGSSADGALQYCIFNHFRAEIDQPVGLTAHKDSGFVTLLYTVEKGLESQDGAGWVPFDPLPGYFTLVLGHSLEVLTARLARPITASYHRVRTTRPRPAGMPDRFTFGTYIGPRWDQPLYEYTEDGRLTSSMSFLDFQKRKAAEMAYVFHPRVAEALG